MIDPNFAHVGDYVCWTIFASRKLERPCWAIIRELRPIDSGEQFAQVEVLAAGTAETKVGAKFNTNIHGWPPHDAVCEVYPEEGVPDEAWAQIAAEKLA